MADSQKTLDAALRRADDLLLSSLQSEESARRRRRRWLLVTVLGGVPVFATAVYLAVSLTTSASLRNHAGGPLRSTRAAEGPATSASLVPASEPAKDAVPSFRVGDTVEIKWGGMWRSATIAAREADIYQVHYAGDRSDFGNEWVTIDRIRTPGSARDIAYARPTPHGQKPDAAARAAALAIFRQSPTPAAGGNDGQTAAQWAGARKLELSGRWSYKPDPCVAPSADAPAPISLGAITGETFEKIDALLLTPAGKAAVSVLIEPPGSTSSGRVDLVDLAAGKYLGTASMPTDTRPLTLSPDGTRMAVVSNKFGLGNQGRVDLLALKGEAAPAVLLSFSPHAGEGGFENDITWAALPDDEHLLTFSRGAKLTLWKVPEARAIWSEKLRPGSIPALSPGGRYVLVETDRSVSLVEILSGRGVGQITVEIVPGEAWTFRPDGRQVAVVGQGRVQVFEVESGKRTADVFLPPGVSKVASGCWAGDRSLLLGNRYLLDIPTGVITWDYQGAAIAAAMGDRLWYVRGSAGRRQTVSPELASAVIPHPAAAAAAASIQAKDYAFHSGMKVSLRVDLAGYGDAGKVTAALTKALEERGMTVAEGQPAVLAATITEGKTHDVRYHLFGSPGERTVSVTDLNLKLQYLSEGKVAWERASLHSAPLMLRLKEGQTTQQAVEESQAAAWKFFEAAELPARMPAPRDPPGLGRSELGEAAKPG